MIQGNSPERSLDLYLVQAGTAGHRGVTLEAHGH